MINLQTFADVMHAKWSEYGNVASPALDRVWLQIAETMNRQATAPSSPRPVIPAELGAGKTTCAKLWCSMLPIKDHPGVLVVVRTMEQADEFAADINAWGAAPSALADHSDVKPRPSPALLQLYPTLVVCHRGYELALDNLLVEEPERFEKLMRYGTRQRKLAIVDEALEQVYVARLVREHFPQIMSLDPRVLKRHPVALDVIESVQRALLDADNGFHIVAAEALLSRTTLTVAEADAAIVALWTDVRTSRYTKPEAKHDVKESLTALRRHLAAYRWTESNPAYRALVGSRLLLPPDAGQIHFDATGALNNVYAGRPDEYAILTLPAVRDYSRVTLYVARTKDTGRWAMKKHRVRIATEARDAVLAYYGDAAKGRRVLVVADNDSEDTVRDIWSEARFGEVAVAHWHALDGRNDWREFDTLVTLTMPWARPSMDLLTHIAVQGVEPDDAGLNAPPDDVRTIRETRMAAQVSQAMGRIRLRRMTDESGVCEPCDIFVRFSHSHDVTLDIDHVLDGIRRTLAGVTVVDWPAMSSPRSRDGRPGVAGSKISKTWLALAAQMVPGDREPLTQARFPGSMFHVVLADAQRAGHPLQAALAGLGAHVEPGGYRAPRPRPPKRNGKRERGPGAGSGRTPAVLVKA